MRPGDDANVRAAALDELSGLPHAVAKHEPVMYLYIDTHALHRGHRRPAIRDAWIGDCNLANCGAQQGLHAEFFHVDGPGLRNPNHDTPHPVRELGTSGSETFPDQASGPIHVGGEEHVIWGSI